MKSDIYIAYRNAISGYLEITINNVDNLLKKISHALRFTHNLFIFIYKMIMITSI